MAVHRTPYGLCDCPWYKGTSISKEAGKLHDHLLNPKQRPDLQTPEAQAFLKELETQYYQPDANGRSKTDALMPWLTREWKKGRINFRPRKPPEYADGAPPRLWHTNPAEDDNPDAYYVKPISPGDVQHWADWYHSNSPNRQGHDIMQSTAWDVHHQKIPEWESWMAEQAKKADLEKGKSLGRVLHQYDDGWTVRQLPPEALQYEGWAMRGKPTSYNPEGVPICVGDGHYPHAVRNGDTAILSLRDPTGQPHVTAELTPQGSRIGEENRGEYDWPNFRQDLERDSVVRHTDDDFKRRLQEIHDEHQNTPSHELRAFSKDPNSDSGDPWELYSHLRDKYATFHPDLSGSTIEQIQGKGNTIPKDEYQDRMKQFFQTFPEQTRPNWDYSNRGSRITHIGALVPDAESYSSNHAGTITGDPDDGEYNDPEMGGYHPHGNYGLVPPPERDIHYNSVLHSLVRPRTYYDERDGRYDYHENEGHALYEEAKRRGEIPQLAQDLGPFQETAMDRYDNHREQNYHYYPQYPGESWDEEPERWLTDEETGERRSPEDAQNAFKAAQQAYYDGEEEAIQNVPEMQVVNHMYNLLSPHWDASQQAYVNTPSPQPPQQNVAKVAAPKPYSNKDVKPLYYRWVYSPANGDVMLAHNWRDHPAEISYHAQMAADRNEPGLVHGYAYRIHGGWRLSDWDHRPVSDPYVVARVIRQLRHQEGVRQAPVAPEQPKQSGLDWDRLHYGLPLPK